jgi:hypothetical protein
MSGRATSRLKGQGTYSAVGKQDAIYSQEIFDAYTHVVVKSRGHFGVRLYGVGNISPMQFCDCTMVRSKL